jgi:uncharacterized protein
VTIERRLTRTLNEDLQKKMVILSGPRQAGKTTLAKSIAPADQFRYYNWDSAPDRLSIQKRELALDQSFWIFDELHKHRRWRQFLKDMSDSFGKSHQILVTGSARLDLYGRGGDSLQGRYFPHHLHPITLSELSSIPFEGISSIPKLAAQPAPSGLLEDLLRLGGFPEPLSNGSDRHAARWRNSYAERLVREEVVSLEQVRELERMELLYDRLSDIAGGVLSINSLREDLDVAFETVRSWLSIFERLDAIFRIPPWGPPRIRSVKKEQKLYFWDWPRCSTEGARFENFIALHLMRTIDWARDVEGEKLRLTYFRHRDGQEVDFVILKSNRPWIAIEAKVSDNGLSPALTYFVERAKPEFAWQVVLKSAHERRLADIGTTQVRVISAARLLANLP